MDAAEESCAGNGIAEGGRETNDDIAGGDKGLIEVLGSSSKSLSKSPSSLLFIKREVGIPNKPATVVGNVEPDDPPIMFSDCENGASDDANKVFSEKSGFPVDDKRIRFLLTNAPKEDTPRLKRCEIIPAGPAGDIFNGIPVVISAASEDDNNPGLDSKVDGLKTLPNNGGNPNGTSLKTEEFEIAVIFPDMDPGFLNRVINPVKVNTTESSVGTSI